MHVEVTIVGVGLVLYAVFWCCFFRGNGTDNIISAKKADEFMELVNSIFTPIREIKSQPRGKYKNLRSLLKI